MRFINNKLLLRFYLTVIFFYCGFLFLSTAAEPKTMRLIPTKKISQTSGIIPFNKDFFNEINRLFTIDVFIETGTYHGDSCAVAAEVFKTIHTVELGQTLYKEVCKRFEKSPHVFPHHGDSGIFLEQILPTIGTGPKIAILLDSHWSGGDTIKGPDLPIMRELNAIKKSDIKNCVIMVDDIRCFQKQPPESPDPYQYPELFEIIRCINEINPNYICVIYGDLLLAYVDGDIIIPQIIQAMTISRLNFNSAPLVALAEDIISNACDEDVTLFAWMAEVCEPSTGYWRTHYYDFWFALALYKRGHILQAKHYMAQAALQGYNRALHYLALWK
jgi:hypothetical protein